MWPMWFAGWLPSYPGSPGDAHARIMIEGMFGAFVVGFLGTAFPRLADSPRLRRGEGLVLLALWLATTFSHGVGRVNAGDAAFSALMAASLAVFLGRWIFAHRDTPPPGVTLAVAAMAIAGTAAALLSRSGGWWMGAQGAHFARLCLYQGFTILPLLGIGPYLLPRFFGRPSSHDFDDSPRPPAGWWPRLAASLACGGAIVATFAIEAGGHLILGPAARAVVVTFCLARHTPVFRRARQPNTPATAVRWAAVSIILGFASAAAWPALRAGALHLYFVSGIGLITFAVATRVVLGHAGRHDLLSGRIVSVRWIIGLAVLASTTRMSADFLPHIRTSHLVYAALAWLIVSILWLAAIGRFLAQTDD